MLSDLLFLCLLTCRSIDRKHPEPAQGRDENVPRRNHAQVGHAATAKAVQTARTARRCTIEGNRPILPLGVVRSILTIPLSFLASRTTVCSHRCNHPPSRRCASPPKCSTRCRICAVRRSGANIRPPSHRWPTSTSSICTIGPTVWSRRARSSRPARGRKNRPHINGRRPVRTVAFRRLPSSVAHRCRASRRTSRTTQITRSRRVRCRRTRPA